MLEKYLIHNRFHQNVEEFTRSDPHLAVLGAMKIQYPAQLWREFAIEVPGIYILTGGRQIGKSTSCKLLIKHCLENGQPTNYQAQQKGDIDEGNIAAQQKRKEIDNAMIEYKNLDSQKMPLLQKEVFTYQAYAETYKGTIGALGELAQAGIAIEQSTLKAEKTIIEGAKELQARLLDTIYQALAESKDDSQKVYHYLIQWIQSMGQANPLSAAPRG